MPDPELDKKRISTLEEMANFFVRVDRNPLNKKPEEFGIEHVDIEFQASDGVNLKGWYMPSENSQKLVVFNHFMLANRAGAVPHPGWGNIQVDFMPIYKCLINAGYNVFSYDLRNHGESDVYEDGRLGLTHIEYQDVIGSVRYAKEHYSGMELYLYSQCYGAVSTIRAMEKSPEDFEGVRAFVNIQPLTAEGYVTGCMAKWNMEHEDNIRIYGRFLEDKTGYTLKDGLIPSEAVKIPTLSVQVKDDWRTTVDSIQDVHNRIAIDDKKMFWIEGEVERLKAYNYFAAHPEILLDWLNSH